jgi:hypothetical protein
MEIRDQVLTRQDAAQRYLNTKKDLWKEYEALFHGYLMDDLSQNTKSQVFDPILSTLAIDRSARVMAQLPTGKLKAISKNDELSAKLMNLTIDKYIIPNANSQFDFLTKLRMTDLYSNIYGNFFTMIDWNIKKNGYVGPDMWLIPIRDVFPQVGAVSVADSDYIIVRTWRPITFFEDIARQKEFKNAGKIYNILKERSGDKDQRTTDDKTKREEEEYPDETPAEKKGYFEVLSQYEGDRWVDIVPAAGNVSVLRDIKNPHENGELPICNKYSIPLLDDFMGMGDFERGKPMQYLDNSLWNLYLDSVKVSIFPPVLIDKDKVSDQSSIKWAAAAKWIMKNGGAVQGAQVLNLTPQGTNTFSSVKQFVSASLLNMFGTTDTAVTEQSDPGFGKTPQALKMQARRENARDNVDRFYMEQFLNQVMKKMVNLMGKKQSSALQIRMFEDEIEELKRAYPEEQQAEVDEMYNSESGKLTINKKKTGSILYDYEIVSGSTYVADQEKQQENLLQLFTLAGNPQTYQFMQQALLNEGKELRVGELLKRIISNSGIKDWSKILIDKTDQEIIKENDTKFRIALAQAGGLNNIPPQPQEVPQETPMGSYEQPGIETEQLI